MDLESKATLLIFLYLVLQNLAVQTRKKSPFRHDEMVFISKRSSACYAGRYPDIVEAYCNGNISSCHKRSLVLHYRVHGKAENRLWKCPSDTSPARASDALCYAKRYPDIAEGFSLDSDHCEDDVSMCQHLLPTLYHYRDYGKDERRIWGCPEETFPPTTAVSRLDLPLSEDPLTIHLLVYETGGLGGERGSNSEVLRQQALAAGIDMTVFGQGTEFQGFSSKYHQAMPLLQKMKPDTLAVLLDARDLILNIPNNTRLPEDGLRFKNAYRALTKQNPGAIVVSAEAQCCVGALSHAKPGDYFDISGRRKQRACHSGMEGCLWAGDDMVIPWMSHMQDLARKITGVSVEDPYLNAGAMAGRPRDLKRVVEELQMDVKEDDQAVFTGFLLHSPGSIVLDYAQEMFGNNRWARGMEAGCMFEEDLSDSSNRGGLVHKTIKTVPLVLHSPGKFFECHNQLANLLEVQIPGHEGFGGGLDGGRGSHTKPNNYKCRPGDPNCDSNSTPKDPNKPDPNKPDRPTKPSRK